MSDCKLLVLYTHTYIITYILSFCQQWLEKLIAWLCLYHFFYIISRAESHLEKNKTEISIASLSFLIVGGKHIGPFLGK